MRDVAPPYKNIMCTYVRTNIVKGQVEEANYALVAVHIVWRIKVHSFVCV